VHECRCIGASGVASLLVAADYRAPLPGQCTDCPQVAGIYKYKGPRSGREGRVEISQRGCHGTISGQGRFVTALGNGGKPNIAMVTASGTMALHGLMKKGAGFWSISWDNGFIYRQQHNPSQEPVAWGHGQYSSVSDIVGWDVLELQHARQERFCIGEKPFLARLVVMGSPVLWTALTTPRPMRPPFFPTAAARFLSQNSS
jgi:hypothetical protein